MLAEVEIGVVPRLHVPASRIYAALDDSGQRTDVVVLDDDREVISILSHLWDRLRLQGLRTTPAVTLTTTANHALLMAQQAKAAGINTHTFTGVTGVEDSLLLTAQHPPKLVPLSELASLPHPLTPVEAARRVWESVRRAHNCGLSHRTLDQNTVWLDQDGQVWITDWDNGEVATNDLARRIDLAQTLALLTAQFGTEVALQTAAEFISEQQLATLAPVMQRLTMPRTTLAAVGKDGMQLLRDVLVSLMPEGETAAPPVQIARFSVRNLVMIVFVVFLVWGVLGSMNFSEIAAAMRTANPWFLAAAFGMGLFYFLGAALALQSFALKAFRLWDAIVVQAASTIVSLVAPAGMGHVAVNLRFVLTRGETMPQALATVALWQTSQVTVTLVFLAALSLFSGDFIDFSLPSSTVIYATAAALVLIGMLLLLKPVRAWLWKITGPTLKQIWPPPGVDGRQSAAPGSRRERKPPAHAGIRSHLGPSAAGIRPAHPASYGGNHIPCLQRGWLTHPCTGRNRPSGGCTYRWPVSGRVPAGAAFSVALVFRLMTMWAPCVVGWFALKSAEKRGLI